MVMKSLKKLNEKEFNIKHLTTNLKQKKKNDKKILKKWNKKLSCASEINAPPEETKYESYPML